MKRVFTFLTVVVILVGCGANPEPLHYGNDACYTCKMTLMDKKFGGEIVTTKGKVYKFDDLNCMINFYGSGYENIENFKHLLVVDFANAETLMDARQAFFIKSDQIRTPMASGVAAFGYEAGYKKFNKEWNGTLMRWADLVMGDK